MPGPVLAERVREVAVAALLVMRWPGPGSRHDFVLAATGYLARNLGPERAGRILEAAVHASGDEEARSRLADVRTTLDRLAAGENVTGGPTLDNLAAGLPAQLARWGCAKRAGERERPPEADFDGPIYSHHIDGGFGENKKSLPLKTVEDILAEAGETVPWVVENVLARGAVTEFSELAKRGGKTTFWCHAIAAGARGEDHAGFFDRTG